MSSHYMGQGRSARSLNQSAYSGYSVGTAASTGRVVRQSPAPKFHPFIIIAVVVSIGVVIVGLVMTVIANWPGYSAIGFNALEIVGPVILGVGGVALIGTVAVVVMRNKNQREVWTQKMIDAERTRAMWASRTTMEAPVTPTHGRPNKSILKKTPSTSTYGRDSNVFEDEDSGFPQPNHMNYDPESDQSNTSSRKGHQLYKIETMPDPTAARQPQYPGQQQSLQYPGTRLSNHSGTGLGHNTSSESESHVPVPIRVPKSKKKSTREPGTPQYATEAYATQEPPLARGSPLVGTPDLDIKPKKSSHKDIKPKKSSHKGYMGDRLSYTSDGAEPMESPPRMMADPPRHAETPKARKQLGSYDNSGYDAYADQGGQPVGQYNPSPMKSAATPTTQPDRSHRGHNKDRTPSVDDDLDRNTEARRSRRKKKKQKSAEGGEKSSRRAEPQADPQLTRINIHAQPGTSVQITPGGPRNQDSQLNRSRSTETEI